MAVSSPCYERVIYGPTAGNTTPDTQENIILPFTSYHSLNINVVYADDEVSYLYSEFSLQFESILYLETTTSTLTDLEEEVARVRDILSTPGLQLKLYPVGLGELPTVNHADGLKDVKGGPFPQDIAIEPIASNNAIMVRGTIMFRLAGDCTPLASPTDPQLLQYNVEQDMEIDDDGDVTFSINMSYQTVEPLTNVSTKNSIVKMLTQKTGKSFQGMRKKVRWSQSRDQRILSIRVIYKEIKSDNALFAFTSNISVNDSIESDLLGSSFLSGKGFYSWKRTISATIKLPARIHKAYAWVVMVKIITARFKKAYLFNKVQAVIDMENAAGMPTAVDMFQTSFYLPLRLKITNSIYSRSLRFEGTWVQTSDLDNLFNNTKIFARVNTRFTGVEEESEPETISEQWKHWQDNKARSERLDGLFQYEINNTPIVFNQCNSTATDAEIQSNALLSYEDDPDWDEGETGGDGSTFQTTNDTQAEDGAYPEGYNDNEFTWLKYENEFEIIEEANSVPVTYLEPPVSSIYYTSSDDGSNSNKNVNGLTIHGRGTGGNSSQSYPSIGIDRAHSTYYVRMKGYALRIDYKIPIPFIVTVGGRAVKRQSNKVSHKQISQGDHPVYLAMWDITYQVTGGDIYSNDIAATIKTTGAPGHYT